MMRKDRNHPGGLRAVVLAVLVHLAVVGVVVVGFQFTSTPSAPVAQPIQATLVEDPRALEAERKRQEDARKKAQAEQRQKEEDAQRRAEEQKRVEEQRRVEEQKRAAEQKRVADQKRQEEEARQKADAERKRQAEIKRQEEERKKAEAEKQRLEAERRKQEEEARRRAAEDSLREQLALEERARDQARAEQERNQRLAAARSQYDAAIRQKVSRNWVLPVGVPEGLKCQVQVRLLPGGEVVDAKVVVPSGNPVFDRSVEVAVRKASPLPIPSDADLFPAFREIRFNFDPAREKG